MDGYLHPMEEGINTSTGKMKERINMVDYSDREERPRTMCTKSLGGYIMLKNLSEEGQSDDSHGSSWSE